MTNQRVPAHFSWQVRMGNAKHLETEMKAL